METATRRTGRLLSHINDSQISYAHQTSGGTQKHFSNPNQVKFYINGAWVDPVVPKTRDVINPATELPVGKISLGSQADVDKAVDAATAAFESFSHTTKQERLGLLEKILVIYKRRYNEIAETISLEMGCPISLSKAAQATCGLMHLMTGIEELKKFQFHEDDGENRIVREPVGVVGMITPWNWPINQISCKVVPALACGCTMVLKPSETAPFDGIIWAEILHEAGVPKGVFNLINGIGEEVGEAISRHPGIHAVTFTGSTRAGIKVAKSAADTVKRVSQELGGKTPNIILEDANLEKAIVDGVSNVLCNNAGQSCNAPTRLLVPHHLHDKAVAIAKKTAEGVVIGDPFDTKTQLGPVVSETQWTKIEKLIEKGTQEGATLVTGGVGRPNGISKGYYVKPTIFANVKNDMTIAREEIFGPVLCILPYKDEEEAVRIANDTPYGLSSEISGTDFKKMERISSRLRAGAVRFNSAPSTFNLPFGGYKQSGNGREWGKWAFHEFLEVKAMVGYNKYKSK
jgi:aldehyde dehydrogenase (NAD+)